MASESNRLPLFLFGLCNSEKIPSYFCMFLKEITFALRRKITLPREPKHQERSEHEPSRTVQSSSYDHRY